MTKQYGKWDGLSPSKKPKWKCRVKNSKIKQEIIKQKDVNKEVVNTTRCSRKVKYPNKLNL